MVRVMRKKLAAPVTAAPAPATTTTTYRHENAIKSERKCRHSSKEAPKLM